MTYDTFTAPGLPNFIANVPPSLADPTFTNRTRSLILSLQNPVAPDAIGADGHLQLRRLSEFASAKRHHRIDLPQQENRSRRSLDRQQPPPGSLRSTACPPNTTSSSSRAITTATLKGATFELIDQGYAMCLVDDGTGTGTKVAKYYHRYRRQLQRTVHLRAVFA